MTFFILHGLHGLEGTNPIDRTFYSINDIHGVSLRGANSVIEDKQGFIWVSSKTGVFRLTDDDARSYLIPYYTPDILTLHLSYGASGLIAYSNNGQFFKYDHLTDQFEIYFDLRSLLNTNRISVFNVLIDEKGVLYIPTTIGLYSYNQKNELNILTEKFREIRYLAWHDQDHLFASRADGILMLDKQGEIRQLFEYDFSSTSSPVSSLFFDEDEERLWIGTKPGLLLYLNVAERNIKNSDLNGLPRQPILAIEANTDSTILLGYDGQGLWEIQRSGASVLNVYRENMDNPSSLKGNGVYDIFKDSNERIWVCTYSGGVSFFEQSAVDVTQIRHIINNPNSLVNNVVNDVFEDSGGNIWFATNNGISRWKPETNKWDSFLSNETGQAQVFLSIYGDSQGMIWAGSWSAGVFVLDGITGKKLDHYFSFEKAKPAFGDFIFDIKEDSQGDLWIVGVVEEVVRFIQKEKRVVRYKDEPVYVIKELNADEMLLGCSYGLVLLNKHNSVQEIILNDYIINDFLVLDGIVWCCTSGGGLIELDINSRKYLQYTIDEGLPSNFVNSVFFANGFLWLGTESGLCRFSPEDDEAFNYSSIIQLANVSFNSSAVIQLRNGHLIFGTNQGAIMFDPGQLRTIDAEGKLFIQDIIISGRTIRDSHSFDLTIPVDSLKELTLDYNQRTVSFELLPKGNSASESKISWKFDALDPIWSAPSSNRLLTFANLPAGEHELKIRMFNNSLSQIIDERRLFITVEPPFWGTWWFYILTVISVMGILYFSFRYHIGLIQKLHSEEKIAFFANTAHEIRTALTLIGGPVEEVRKEEQISERGRYYLALATEQVKHLLNIATQLLDFQKFDIGKGQLRWEVINVVELIRQRMDMFESYAQKNQVTLAFQSEVESAMTAVDVDKIVKVFDNLISNAIKYSYTGGEVNLTFSNKKNNWVLTVSDQGMGVDASGKKRLFNEFYRSDNAVNSEIEGSGIGLLMVKSYVENHHGKVSFNSEENKGSVFKIEVPYLGEGDFVSDVPSDVNRKLGLPNNMSASSKRENGQPLSIQDIHILIVEDNENLRAFMKVALGEAFIVQAVSNGKEAWAIIKKELPDLVVSDIMMPEMDGFELCRLMKSTYETSHIPVVLLTALTEKAEQMQGIGLGADAYLTKPFDVPLLISRISSIISNRKVIREKALKLIHHAPEENILENELNDQFVKKALDIVKLNISNPEFTKDLFASELNVSSSLLYKKIKSLTDQSPTDFIKSIRLNQAIELLKSRQHTITEVSELCGFSSVGYFSTVFKKYYRKTPSEVLEG